MKNILIIILAILIPAGLLAQEKKKKSGMTMGVNLAKWNGDADLFAKDLSDAINMEPGFSSFSFSNESRVGFVLGFFIEYPVLNSFSIQPELSFIQKGTKFAGNGRYTYDDGWESYTFDVEEDMIMQTNYLDLLALAKYNLANGKVIPYLLLGPGISYMVTSKMKVKVTIDGESESDSQKYKNFNKVDANVNLGFGLEFYKKARLEVRYQFGLVPILQDEYSDGYIMRNSGLAFNFVIVF